MFVAACRVNVSLLLQRSEMSIIHRLVRSIALQRREMRILGPIMPHLSDVRRPTSDVRRPTSDVRRPATGELE